MDAIDKSAKAKAAYRQRLHEKGLCIKCRNPLEPERSGLLLCAECEAKGDAQRRARYHRLKEQGICVWCGKSPAQAGRTLCLGCAVRRSGIQTRYYRRRTDGLTK